MLTVMVVLRQFLKIHMLLQLFFASLCSICHNFTVCFVTKTMLVVYFAKTHQLCCYVLVFVVAMARMLHAHK